MKIKGKFITFVVGMFLLFFALPMTVKAEELPTTSDGKEVVLTDFEILDEKVSYYDFESRFPLYDIYDDMLWDIKVEGIKYKLCYSVDGVTYESISTIRSSNNPDGIQPDLEGLEWNYEGLNIFISWKNYTTKEVDGETCYNINTKNNALVCQCGDMVVEVPVEFNVPTPVKEIAIVENPWEDGLYEYKYQETLGSLDFIGLKFKIVYTDGTTSDIISSPEEQWEIRESSGYEIIKSAEMVYDEETGERTGTAIVTIDYMGVEEKLEISILQNPIKKIELTKKPKKMVYNIADDTPDLYGATLKITYHDGTKETIKIKSHKTEIPVKNTFNDSIKLDYGSGWVTVNYLGESLSLKVPTDVSSLGKTTTITAGKGKTETLTANAPTRVYTLTAKKTGRYQMSFSGEKIRLKAGGKKQSTEFTVYVLDQDGYLQKSCSYDDEVEDCVVGLTKGEKYYFYVYIPDVEYYGNDNDGTPRFKHKFTSKVSYLGGFIEQNIIASDIKKKYGEDSFFIDAKAASGSALTYTSSNKKVATVTKDGEVKIKGIGTTEITIKAPAAGIYKAATKKITLTITKGNANLKVKKSSYSVPLGSKAFKLGATAETDITYKSSNTKVATVNSKGKVTVKGCGKATITITAGDEKYKKATKKVTIKVVPKTAKIKTAKSKKAGQLTVTWSKQKESKGYVIEYSTDKNFKKNVKTATIKKNGTVSKTLKNLKKGTVYYVRVKAYIEIDGKKVYGESSKVKSVTVK